MAYINIPEGLAGILGPLAFRPETAKPLGELTDVLLRGPNTLSRAEREMIAARVSWLNRCHFCHSSHAAIAASHLGGTEADFALIDQVARDPEGAPISAKMKALLAIASLVAEDGKKVTPDLVERARQAGATDVELHDTVLIAGMFCMFNRYVDGLGTWQPDDPTLYRQLGRTIAEQGYAGSAEAQAAAMSR
ncbi:MAG: peroxidase-related enzyme [Acidobacteriota bacterium]|nr:MAG: carboxymuconolactone decarboxylase [Acidobacteriota bacterium]